MEFRRASKEQSLLRLGLVGPSGSGKTWTALAIGCAIAAQEGGRCALIDTENGSASKYADKFDFDTLSLPETDTTAYVEAIRAAERAGYRVIVLDSSTHAWETSLEQKDLKASRGGNSFTAWAEISPRYRAFTDAQLKSSAHIIATMRAKTEYVLEDRNGKQVPKKVGMAPVIRPGYEYEYDLVGYLDLEHNMAIEKTRYSELDGKTVKRPDGDFALKLYQWLRKGSPPAPPKSEEFHVGPDGERRDGPKPEFPHTVPAPAVQPQVVPAELERLLGRLTKLEGVFNVFAELKAGIVEATGTEALYYEILAKHGMRHASDVKGHKRGEVKAVVVELYFALVECRKALEPPPYEATEDDVPPEIGGAA
jgi:energy-coupling factor transporter ATP-binding protein EcfA2